VEGIDRTRPGRIARLAPISDWLPRYDRSALRGDALAGIAVAAMIVPKDLGYAGIAGIPVQNGLYAAAAGAIVYAVFCTSRHISTGPSSSLAAVAGGAVLAAGVQGAQAAELVAAITLVTGALFLLLAVLRLGWVARFLSRAVVTGFLAGAAVDVVIGELPKLTGTSASGETAWGELASWIRSLDEVSGTTVLVGVAALAVILVLRFSAPRVPGALVLVIGGLIATPAFNLETHGVALVGTVPRGLPTPGLPDLDVFRDHFPTILAAAAGLLLIGFSQTAGDARAFAARHRYRVDLDQESVAQGMANMAAGAFHGMPVSTSLSASSLNESAGARTPLASLVTGGLVLLTLVALAPLFSDLPKAVLAAIIIDAVVFGMIDIAELRRLWGVKRVDFWVAAMAIVAVLSAGVLAGVVIGIALSLVWLVYVTTTPEMPLLGRDRETHVFRDALEHPGDETFPGYAVLRLEGGLFFATADALEARVRSLAQDGDPPLRAVVLDMEGVDFVDSQGAATLAEILDFAEGAGVRLSLARVKPSVGKVLATDGVLERLGADGVHDGINLAVEAQLAVDRPATRG
jgi:sulfate permease, SulP family